jgi:DNA modification methylase
MWVNKVLVGDCRDSMRQLIADGVKVQCVVTSPPYWGLRDYGIPPSVWGGDTTCQHQFDKAHCVKCNAWQGCLGLEPDYRLYLQHMIEVFALVWELLREDGTLWLNLGDTYVSSGGTVHQGKHGSRAGRTHTQRNILGKTSGNSGLKNKDQALMPHRTAIALQEWGWWVRSDIVWHKKNPSPSSVRDRPTSDHEYLFLMARSERYYYDQAAIREPVSPDTHARASRARGSSYQPAGQKAHNGIMSARPPGVGPKAVDLVDSRNKRTVWSLASAPYSGAHTATFPPKLIEPCILAGSKIGDVVFDPFMGSGTTAYVAEKLGRRWLGCEIGQHFQPLIKDRTTVSAALDLG